MLLSEENDQKQNILFLLYMAQSEFLAHIPAAFFNATNVNDVMSPVSGSTPGVYTAL
jgi:hypothetical protein